MEWHHIWIKLFTKLTNAIFIHDTFSMGFHSKNNKGLDTSARHCSKVNSQAVKWSFNNPVVLHPK